jgi:hypothetical protein
LWSVDVPGLLQISLIFSLQCTTCSVLKSFNSWYLSQFLSQFKEV